MDVIFENEDKNRADVSSLLAQDFLGREPDSDAFIKEIFGTEGKAASL